MSEWESHRGRAFACASIDSIIAEFRPRGHKLTLVTRNTRDVAHTGVEVLDPSERTPR